MLISFITPVAGVLAVLLHVATISGFSHSCWMVLWQPGLVSCWLSPQALTDFPSAPGSSLMFWDFTRSEYTCCPWCEISAHRTNTQWTEEGTSLSLSPHTDRDRHPWKVFCRLLGRSCWNPALAHMTMTSVIHLHTGFSSPLVLLSSAPHIYSFLSHPK